MKLPTFLNYFNKNLPKSYIFDFDETLFRTSAKIIIKDIKTKKIIKKLSPNEFNTYKKNSNEIIDLHEFEDPNILLQAIPIYTKSAFIELKNSDNNISNGENGVIYILTARGIEVKDAIFNLLKKYKIYTIKYNNILTVAQEIRAEKTTIALKKYEIVSKIKPVSSSIEFYDDNQENIDAVKIIPGVITIKV